MSLPFPLADVVLFLIQAGSPTENPAVSSTLIGYLLDLPILAVYLVGIILSIVFWKRSPRVSILTLIALIGLSGVLLLAGLNPIIFNALREHNHTLSEIEGVMRGLNFFYRLIGAGCWVLVLVAIFGSRRPAVSGRA